MAIEPNAELLVQVGVSSSSLPRSEYPKTWSNSMMDDYSSRGDESDAVAQKANQAAEGAYQAQKFSAQNERSISDLSRRVDSLSRQVSSISASVNGLIEFNKNPYATLFRGSTQAILVPDSANTDATFDSSIPGRKVTLSGSRITLNEGGVYRLTSTLDFSASSSFTIEVIVGSTVWFSFSGASVSVTTPVIDVPASANDAVYVNINQTTGGDLTVTQGNIYLSISRQGSA